MVHPCLVLRAVGCMALVRARLMVFDMRCQVIAVRDGSKVHISCRDIVVGDISKFRPRSGTAMRASLELDSDNSTPALAWTALSARCLTCICRTVHLCAGDLAPADGAIFQKSDLAISEKMLTGETALKHKGMYRFTGREMPDEPVSMSPAVFAGTYVEVSFHSALWFRRRRRVSPLS